MAENESLDRRAILRTMGVVATGGLAMAAVEGVVRPTRADAATGTMKYGAFNDAGQSPTVLSSTGTFAETMIIAKEANGQALTVKAGDTFMAVDSVGIEVASVGLGIDVKGDQLGAIIARSRFAAAILGRTGKTSGKKFIAGVVGDSDERPGVAGLSLESTGVFGLSVGGTSDGVVGKSRTGRGVVGDATGAGTGVFASASVSRGGTALQVNGVARFNRSGIATVPAGSNSVTVTGVSLTSASFVVATIQGALANNAVAAVYVTPSTSRVKIVLQEAAAVNVKVGWVALS